MEKYKWGVLIMLSTLIAACNPPSINSELLVNHVGYPEKGEKKVIFQTQSNAVPEAFVVKNDQGEVVYNGVFAAGGAIASWHTGDAYVGLFSDLENPGTYVVECKVAGVLIRSVSFQIKHGLLAQQALPLMLKGFKSVHPEEKYETWDAEISFHGDRKDKVDVRGGWYDASGDFSKYLTHLTYTNFMMPQQTPMVAYNLLASAEHGEKQGLYDQALLDELIEESAWGADFLVRMQDPEGYFYTIVFDNWSKDPARREICAYETQNGNRTTAYQAAFREGAGISIAALAKLSAANVSGSFSSQEYLVAAEKGFAHLLENNSSYCDDGIENIIDDYCALLAATELYGATAKKQYLSHARMRVDHLAKRISSDEYYKGWFRADEDGTRSYFHAAEAGYPIIALSRYVDFEHDEVLMAKAIITIQQAVAFELAITNEVHNPYGYPRQYVKAVNEDSKRASFFVPHENESGYWYQGENARIASLAAAFNLSKAYLLPEQQKAVNGFVQNQINWVMGLNPYNICMLDGLGYNNPEYLEPHDWNYVGGIANGITAGVENESDLAFLPDPQGDDSAQRWRWPEQWIPHAGWFILALTTVE